MIELKKLSHVCINRGNAQICQKRGKNTINCIYLILKFVVVSEDILSFALAVIAIICAQVTFLWNFNDLIVRFHGGRSPS